MDRGQAATCEIGGIRVDSIAENLERLLQYLLRQPSTKSVFNVGRLAQLMVFRLAHIGSF
jgi:hypothetical protein